MRSLTRSLIYVTSTFLLVNALHVSLLVWEELYIPEGIIYQTLSDMVRICTNADIDSSATLLVSCARWKIRLISRRQRAIYAGASVSGNPRRGTVG